MVFSDCPAVGLGPTSASFDRADTVHTVSFYAQAGSVVEVPRVLIPLTGSPQSPCARRSQP